MTNVSEFERVKPRKTYKAIKQFEEELSSLMEFGKREVDTFYVFEKLKQIKEIFLTGE